MTEFLSKNNIRNINCI